MKTELQIRIDETLKSAFDKACETEGTTKSAAIREFIARFVKNSEKRRGK